MSSFSLADSDTGSRIGRAETADYDRRGRNVRPRESREGSTSAPAPALSLPSIPSIILESTTAINDVVGAFYVQDIDAEEGEGDKDKEEFKQETLTLILSHLFDGPGLAEKLSKELGKSIIRWWNEQS
jgi:hypothetical protein